MGHETSTKGRGEKSKKTSNLESSLKECKQKLEAVEKKSKSLQQKYNKEKSTASYCKNKVKHLTSKIKEQNQIVQYYENMSCEQKEKTNLVEKNIIQTFKDGKYTDEIHQVYYEMLHINVSVDKCGDLLKVVLKKVAQIDADRIP